MKAKEAVVSVKTPGVFATAIFLSLAAKSYAFIKQRGYVIPEDVRKMCHEILRHRISVSYEAEAENITSEDIIKEILNKVEIP